MGRFILLFLMFSTLLSFGQDAQVDAARKKFDGKDYKGAKEELTRIISANGRNKAALILRGRTKAALEDYYGAIGDFNFALELDSTSYEPYFLRAEAKMALGD